MKRVLGFAVFLALAAAIVGKPVTALADGVPADKAKASIDKGLAFLKSKQNKDHSWGEGDISPALTGLALRAFVSAGYDPDTEFLDKGFDALVDFQKSSGGIYTQSLAVYNTAIAVSALASAPNEQELKEPLKKALDYLKSLQWSDTITGLPNNEQVKPGDIRIGGWGYGGGKPGHAGRPDGSNLNIAMDALHDAGLKPDDPAYKRAVEFLNHLQNNSETNKGVDGWVPSDDGGFIYSPVNNGMSPAGEYTDASGHRLVRSYGSMIYAGLSKDDPRVKAAWSWITHNWTVDRNPGMGEEDPKHAQDGLYYYYHTMARALRAYGEPVITDAQGNKHDWRVELIDKIVSMQQPDGQWTGENKWMENHPEIVTAYTVLALEEALDDLKDHPAK